MRPQQPPLPLPPHMRGRADREPSSAADMARPPEQGPPYRAAEAEGSIARNAPVATRTRLPEQEPRPYRAAEVPAAREAPVATRTRLPEQEPRPYRAAEPRAAPVATMARPPGPHCAPEGRETREAPAASVPRSPEQRPGPHHLAEGRTAREAPVAAVLGSPEPRPSPYPYYYVPEPRPPYPDYAPERPVRVRRTSALASCLVAAIFLLLAGGGAATALFLLFRPRPPDIAVAAVRLPTFAAGNGTVAFTFEQMATVRNPNRAPLAHFDSSLRVAYAGGEVGSVYIPAGLIDGGRSKYMSASFAVPAFPAATPPPLEVAAQQPAAAMVMEVDSLLVVKGKVTLLWVLTHRVQASKVCRVGVSPVDGRVLGFRC